MPSQMTVMLHYPRNGRELQQGCSDLERGLFADPKEVNKNSEIAGAVDCTTREIHAPCPPTEKRV
jgi:hypothetical protein